MLSEWLMLMALTWLVGSVAVPVLIMSSAAAQPLRDATRHARRCHIVLGSLLLVVASVLAVFLPHNWFVDGRLAPILIMRLFLLCVIGVALARGSRYIGVILVAGCALLLMQSLLSHSAMLRDWVGPVFNDWLHLTLSSVWAGGVGLLAFVLAPATLRQPLLMPALSASLQRFSPVAMFCAVGLGMTGLIQAAQFMPGLGTLWTTPYGNLVLLKLVLFCVLMGFGAIHQFVLLPRLRPRLLQPALPFARARFGLSIAAELVVSLVVLVLAAGLKVLAV